MNTFLKMAVTTLALVGTLGVLPGVASAAEAHRPAAASIGRDHGRGGRGDRDHDRGGRWDRDRRHDRDWARDHRGWCADHRFYCR